MSAAGCAHGDRADLFVTSKFNKEWSEKVPEAYERSLDALGLDYLDLFLIHWPNPSYDRYVQAWEGLVGLLNDGRVRAIGNEQLQARAPGADHRRDGRRP